MSPFLQLDKRVAQGNMGNSPRSFTEMRTFGLIFSICSRARGERGVTLPRNKNGGQGGGGLLLLFSGFGFLFCFAL